MQPAAAKETNHHLTISDRRRLRQTARGMKLFLCLPRHLLPPQQLPTRSLQTQHHQIFTIHSRQKYPLARDNRRRMTGGQSHLPLQLLVTSRLTRQRSLCMTDTPGTRTAKLRPVFPRYHRRRTGCQQHQRRPEPPHAAHHPQISHHGNSCFFAVVRLTNRVSSGNAGSAI